MTTTSKTASKPRKKAAKKAPKAKVAPQAPAVEETLSFAIPEQTPEQQQAKLNAYATLKNAKVPIPDELALEVRAIVAAAQAREAEAAEVAQQAKSEEQKQIEEENKTGPIYLRNTYPAPFSMRLERQGKDTKKIELKPRGVRGDMFPVQEGDLQDTNVSLNLELGRIEILKAGDAKAILSKQTRNMGRTHTPLAVLRNENGKPYAPDSIKVEAEYNSQGVTVAVMDPSIGAQHENAKWATGQKSAQGGLIRTDGMAPEQVAQFIPTGGNPAIISSGFQDPNTQAKIADDAARVRGAQGPSAGGILAVTVDPVQKS